jgi:hypothetical protein
VLLFDRFVRKFTFCVRSRQFAEGGPKWRTLPEKARASFPWTLSCATMGLAVSVSLCFAQGDRDTSKELQRVQPFACDSLDPKVCFDIYQRRIERIPATIHDQGDNNVIAAGQRLERCLSYDPRPDPFGKPKKDQKLSDYCSPIATRFDLCETKRGECR